MADKTLIGWTDATWNIITGCSMFRVGKARAGRLLDGRTWDEMPGSKGVQANDQT